MKAIIGAKLLKSREVAARNQPFDIFDERLKGFILRVQISGHLSYYALLGRGKRQLIGVAGHLTPEEARERCSKVFGNVSHGRPPLEGIDGAAPSLTLGEFIGVNSAKGTYAEWRHANKPKYADSYLKRLQTNFGKWYTRPLAAITATMIEDWRTDRLNAGKSPTTVLKDVMDLSSVFTRARKWKKIAINPVGDVEKPKIDRTPKVRFLDEAEEKRLRTALDERDAEMRAKRESHNKHLRERKQKPMPSLDFGDALTPAVILTMNTGLRNGELVSLRWEDVDLKSRSPTLTVVGGTAKNRQTRHVDLNTQAVDLLKRWQKQSPDKERVFPQARFKTAWNALLKQSKITKFRWHDLRHHFASRLAQAGVPLNTIRDLMGHADIKMTLRYAHLAPGQRADAVALLVRK